MKTLETWRPSAREGLAGVELPEAEAKVLAQLDGHTGIADVSSRTGMAVEDVLVAMSGLVRRGALDAADVPREVVQLAHMPVRKASAPPPPLDVSIYDELEMAGDARESEDVDSLPELEIIGVPTEEDLEELPELEVVGDAEEIQAADAGSPRVPGGPDEPPTPDDEAWSESVEDEAWSGSAEDDETWSGSAEDDEAWSESAEDEGGGSPSSPPTADSPSVGSYRQVFETTLRPLPVEVRVEWAHTGSGDVLFALCMDPMPGVIQAVLENPNANLEHARLIAEHHRHPIGLDALGKRSEYLRDSTVRRFLMRNQQASERLLVRMLGGLPLTQIFRANVGHELTDRSRRAGRMVLRRKFDQAQADEKVGLIVQTEGRCLANLVGLTFDQKTVALLCRRTYPSSMLIQSLARFPATPPTLIVHLLRQQGVLRNAHVKKRLQQHPNCPKYLKR